MEEAFRLQTEYLPYARFEDSSEQLRMAIDEVRAAVARLASANQKHRMDLTVLLTHRGDQWGAKAVPSEWNGSAFVQVCQVAALKQALAGSYKKLWTSLQKEGNSEVGEWTSVMIAPRSEK